jgi:hypothetical protein
MVNEGNVRLRQVCRLDVRLCSRFPNHRFDLHRSDNARQRCAPWPCLLYSLDPVLWLTMVEEAKNIGQSAPVDRELSAIPILSRTSAKRQVATIRSFLGRQFVVAGWFQRRNENAMLSPTTLSR